MVPLPPARPTPTNAPAPEQGSTRARRPAPTSRRWTAATSGTRTGAAMRVRVPGPPAKSARTRTGAAMRLGPRWWRAVASEDPHRRSDETPAPITRARFTSSRPPAATTGTPSTFGSARIRPTGPGPGRGGSGLRNSSSAQRDPGAGAGMGRARLAQCEPSATKSTPPRAVRAQRDEIRPSSIRASPPRTMRPEVTSPNRLPQGAGARLPGDAVDIPVPTPPGSRGAPPPARRPGCRRPTPPGAETRRRTAPRVPDRVSGPGAGRAGASARRVQWWAPRWVQWSRRNGGCRGGRRGPGRFPAPARRRFLGPPRLVGRWARSALLAPQVPRAARASPDTE